MPVPSHYEDYEPILTAHELAQLLLAEPDLPVRMEGCDCTGECGGVEVEEDYILLARTHSIADED